MSIDKRIDYEIQGGVKNFRPSEMETVPKIAKSSPNTPTAKLAYITPEEEKIATKYLKEEVSVSAIKKHNHLQKKYKERYKLKPVKRTVADESFDEFDSNSTDG